MVSTAEERADGPAAAAVPRRVWTSTALLVLGRVWGSACTLLTLALLARHLPGEGFGRLTFYLAVFLVLDSFVDLGTGHAALQRSATDEENLHAVLRTARRVRLATGLVGVALVGGGAFLVGEPGAGWILVAALYPVTHVLELSTLVFKNRIAWSRPVLVRASAAGFSLAFVLGAWAADVREPALFLVAIAGGSAIGNGLLHLVGRRHLPARAPAAAPLVPFLLAAVPMGVAALLQQTYFWVDNLFVRALVGTEAVGRYNLAVRVMSFGIMAAVYATLAALPWLAREHAAGRLASATARLAQPMLALAAFGAGAAWPFAAPLLELLGGDPAFASAAGALRWLLLATVAVYVGSALLTAVVAAGRPRGVLGTAILALAVNLAGNAWLVPRRGMEGAAIATVATEVVVAVGAGIVLARAGVRPWRERPIAWLAAPLAFLLGRVVGAAV